jgi:hypothetical protein
MPTFTYKDEQTGQTITLDRETEPTDAEIEREFSARQRPTEAAPAAPAAPAPTPAFSRPTEAPASVMQFAPQSIFTQRQAPPAVAAQLEIMPELPKAAPLPPRPTVKDAIKKAVELSMGGAFGRPTTAQINQLYLAMQDDYDRSIKPVDKSERDKAYEIFTNEFIFDNKRMPNPKEARELYQRAATAGTRQYSEGFMVRDSNGGFVGFTFLDPSNGTIKVRKLDGSLVDMTQDYIPATATSFQKDVLPINDFMKLRGQVTDDEISLNRMSAYVKKVKDIPTGIRRLADEVSANFKTLLGNKITREQITQKIARGELQGLIGATRLATVGGGVMTEQDAIRVLQRLGGDVDAFQNPEVVQRAIADVYGERYRRYQDNVNSYNMAVDNYYGRKGSQGASFYRPIKPIEIDPIMEEGATGIYGAPATLEDKKARLKALEDKLKGN